MRPWAHPTILTPTSSRAATSGTAAGRSPGSTAGYDDGRRWNCEPSAQLYRMLVTSLLLFVPLILVLAPWREPTRRHIAKQRRIPNPYQSPWPATAPRDGSLRAWTMKVIAR